MPDQSSQLNQVRRVVKHPDTPRPTNATNTHKRQLTDAQQLKLKKSGKKAAGEDKLRGEAVKNANFTKKPQVKIATTETQTLTQPRKIGNHIDTPRPKNTLAADIRKIATSIENLRAEMERISLQPKNWAQTCDWGMIGTQYKKAPEVQRQITEQKIPLPRAAHATARSPQLQQKTDDKSDSLHSQNSNNISNEDSKSASISDTSKERKVDDNLVLEEDSLAWLTNPTKTYSSSDLDSKAAQRDQPTQSTRRTRRNSQWQEDEDEQWQPKQQQQQKQQSERQQQQQQQYRRQRREQRQREQELEFELEERLARKQEQKRPRHRSTQLETNTDSESITTTEQSRQSPKPTVQVGTSPRTREPTTDGDSLATTERLRQSQKPAVQAGTPPGSRERRNALVPSPTLLCFEVLSSPSVEGKTTLRHQDSLLVHNVRYAKGRKDKTQRLLEDLELEQEQNERFIQRRHCVHFARRPLLAQQEPQQPEEQPLDRDVVFGNATRLLKPICKSDDWQHTRIGWLSDLERRQERHRRRLEKQQRQEQRRFADDDGLSGLDICCFPCYLLGVQFWPKKWKAK